jgi:SAM-dependent methyltransferase
MEPVRRAAREVGRGRLAGEAREVGRGRLAGEAREVGRGRLAGEARYDGYAEWYDQWRQPHVEDNAAEITAPLGPGEGPCLDLGCGTGLLFGALAATGRTVTGLDYSADQLRFAARRSRRVVRGDGAALPFGDGTFLTVVAS